MVSTVSRKSSIVSSLGLLSAAAAGIAAIGLAPPIASASPYSAWQFSYTLSGTVSAGGYLVTNGSPIATGSYAGGYAIQGISGSRTDETGTTPATSPINGILGAAGVNQTDYNSSHDNVLYPTKGPSSYFDSNGLLYSTGTNSSTILNVYNSTEYLAAGSNANGSNNYGVTISVTSVADKVWQYIYSGGTGANAVSGIGDIITAASPNGSGGYNILGILGTQTVGGTTDTTTAVIPPFGSSGSYSGHAFDNIFYPGPAYFDSQGLLFSTMNGPTTTGDVNINYTGGAYSEVAGGTTTPINFSLAAIPEPAPLPLLAAAGAAIILLLPQKRRVG